MGFSVKKMIKNFYPTQYREDNKKNISHNYLNRQFNDYKKIFSKIEKLVKKSDFTLGEEVNNFEKKFARLVGCKFAVGVGSGTDALFLSLKAYGFGNGDEVITTPYTFYATIGAIVTAGCKPVFVDISDDMNIDVEKIEKKISKKTKAIIPVHWTGKPCNMNKIKTLAKKYNLKIIEDACHSIKAKYNNKSAGNLGNIGCFSFHPLKNLNVWGDGGIITTNSIKISNKLRLLRNHGLVSRDRCSVFGYNSRLDTIQAIIANHMLEKIDHITKSRIENSKYLDSKLKTIKQIKIPVRDKNIVEVFHLYIIKCQKRNKLLEYLNKFKIDAKVHYSQPMHLQKAAKYLKYKKGDFPVTERTVNQIISLPVHEFVTKKNLDFMISKIRSFYS